MDNHISQKVISMACTAALPGHVTNCKYALEQRLSAAIAATSVKFMFSPGLTENIPLLVPSVKNDSAEAVSRF